ncbi:uncharacterized protein SCHCODRAFT_02631499 [Schizophyllum commune H4-8]|nr:uncharacterized protein SCHCODRAFT_02631499 [Schizophyllum commune H4-8]KAI5890321.1 hypothetical protein SCHCODRAFT_02631499 [Schizophyllum commune H4-8]
MLRADEEVLQYLSAFSLLIVQKATSSPAPHSADQFILDGLELARLSDTYRPRLDAREDRPRALYRTSLRLLREIEKAAIRIMLRAMGAPVDAIFALETMEEGRQLDARDLMALAALLRDPVGELEFRGLRWTDNRSRRTRDPLDLDAYDFDEPPDMYDESMLVGVLALEYTKVVNQRQLDLEEEEDDNDNEESDEDEDMSSDEEDEDMSASDSEDGEMSE